MYALLKCGFQLFAVPCNDITEIKNFIKFTTEEKLGTYELALSSSDYCDGLHVQSPESVFIGWPAWLEHGEHKFAVEFRHNHHAEQSITLHHNITQVLPSQEKVDRARDALRDIYTKLEKAISIANAYGSGPFHIDNDILRMRRHNAAKALQYMQERYSVQFKEHPEQLNSEPLSV